jgi:hypothetical protein
MARFVGDDTIDVAWPDLSSPLVIAVSRIFKVADLLA